MNYVLLKATESTEDLSWILGGSEWAWKMEKKISFGWTAFDFKSWLRNFNIDDALTIKIVDNYVRVLSVCASSSFIFLHNLL